MSDIRREDFPPHSQLGGMAGQAQGWLLEQIDQNKLNVFEALYIANYLQSTALDLMKYRELEKEERPLIVCLCGSTRFYDAFRQANLELTLAGIIVLSIGCDTKSDEGLCITPEQKIALDKLHKEKIRMADEVYVLNVGGYIGESTRSEIDYAVALGKPIRYLEVI